MKDEVHQHQLSLGDRAIYQIEVQGALESSWTEEIGDMVVKRVLHMNGVIVATLIGELADQAALAGVLNLTFMLGMPLLSVTYLGRAGIEKGVATWV